MADNVQHPMHTHAATDETSADGLAASLHEVGSTLDETLGNGRGAAVAILASVGGGLLIGGVPGALVGGAIGAGVSWVGLKS